MKVLVYSIFGFEKPFIEKAAHGNHELVFTEQHLDESTAYLAQGFDAVSLSNSDVASEAVLQKLYNCGVKYIALRGVSSDFIDVPRAKSLAMKVANVPSNPPYSVAEHAVGLVLALNRKLILGQRLMDLGDYRMNHLVGFDLHGKTVGIIGTGKIGATFARIMHGFGCKIVAFDSQENKELLAEIPISYLTFEEVCAAADVLSIHSFWNSSSKILFDKTQFSFCKKGIIFINTAHWKFVNTEDLIEAVENKTLAAVGLDVYEKEESLFFIEHTEAPITDLLFLKLRSYPNVLITGNQGLLTNETLAGIAHTTIANLNAWAYNGISENEIS
ncbi:NAD(P)-dependent oxidoreductase [Flavobacterium sandaracinum]|uniref:2-hydroxyacid dehydrogenase n=1 Tax=Flavobacterium sandaracinum TaxID=2541733 RepID=A0A4R5D127_9FLAO|nr:NAD(P)-dependent oxidoreductase [Flavobacterium sandaracinum]TDE06912.1 2-hydroxyacid dehydrogenase [Flavobacterium sandaracinum]